MKFHWINAEDISVDENYVRSGKIIIELRIPQKGELVLAKLGDKKILGYSQGRYGDQIELHDHSGSAIHLNESWVILGTVVHPADHHINSCGD